LPALLTVGASVSRAQADPVRGWSIGFGVGPFRIDDLAGTPLVPTVQVLKTGRAAAFGATGTWVNDAGFYSLTSATLDLGVGVRTGSSRTDLVALAGPTGMLGGDSDGTPYILAGVHGTLTATWWPSDRVGVSATGVMRVWVTTGNSRFAPSATAGLRLRL
jgi:hypothetical protein